MVANNTNRHKAKEGFTVMPPSEHQPLLIKGEFAKQGQNGNHQRDGQKKGDAGRIVGHSSSLKRKQRPDHPMDSLL
jgi:hypothetical protein